MLHQYPVLQGVAVKSIHIIFRKTFRYPVADFFLLFSYFIAFITLFISVSIFEKQWNFDEDKTRYAFADTYYASVHRDDGIGEWKVDPQEGCVIVEGLGVTLSKGGTELSSIAGVILGKTELPSYIQGKMPEEGLVIGSGVANALGVNEGDAVLVDDDYYTVGTILKDGGSDYLSGIILFDYKRLHVRFKNKMLRLSDWDIAVSTSKGDAFAVYNRLKKAVDGENPEIVFTGKFGEQDENYGKTSTAAWYYMLLYLFALFQCVVAADLWIHVRQYEIAVKACHGYSSRDIFKDLFVQSFRLCSLVAVFCFAMQRILTVFGKKLFGVSLSVSPRNLLILALFTFGTSFVAVSLGIRGVSRTANDQLIRGNE